MTGDGSVTEAIETDAAAGAAPEVSTDPPIGARRSADRLAERTELSVAAADVEMLVERGLLTSCGTYKRWALYDPSDLDAVDVDVLAAIVAERLAWIEASVSTWDAPSYLGWRRDELARVAADRGLSLGPLDRYATADLDALAGDEQLAEQLRLDRLLTAAQAAEHLEIRDTDFKYLVAAELAVPHRYTTVEVTRYRDVSVPLYRVGDLDELRDHPGIDWEAVRAVKPGKPSPLRELARRPVDRAVVIRRWVAELGDRHHTEVWAWWNNAAGQWEIDYERVDGAPTVKQVRAELAAHTYLARYRNDIAVATDAGAAIRWARAMREPGAAVILDTETTDLDGYVVEIAVVDAATGDTLLDTLVNPGCPIQPGARWVHGISDNDVSDAPRWAEVLPDLLRVTEGRTVLAYNASFDSGVVCRHSHRDGLDPGHLAADDRWACLMGRRSDWQMRRRWLPLGGGHRALGDCRTAYELLCAMTAPARQPKTARR